MTEVAALYGGQGASSGSNAESTAGTRPVRKPMTLFRLAKMHAEGEKIAMLTCYDACFAKLLDAAGVDILLVGDSLGMVLQGHDSTLPVTVEEMAYHTRSVARGARHAMVMADMPFASYQESPQQALHNAAALMRAGAHMVKLEGGAWLAETVRFLVERGVPVCAHIGFTPQSVHQLGGYRVQGRGENAQRMREDALALAQAGASLVLMEMVPRTLAGEVTASLGVPTIGIGAGPACSGQVLVMHDMLGAVADVSPKFVKNFLAESTSLQQAVAAYVTAVKRGEFPAPEHCFD